MGCPRPPAGRSTPSLRRISLRSRSARRRIGPCASSAGAAFCPFSADRRQSELRRAISSGGRYYWVWRWLIAARRKFSREFKVEAAKLLREMGRHFALRFRNVSVSPGKVRLSAFQSPAPTLGFPLKSDISSIYGIPLSAMGSARSRPTPHNRRGVPLISLGGKLTPAVSSYGQRSGVDRQRGIKTSQIKSGTF